jgi:hypothetical protein
MDNRGLWRSVNKSSSLKIVDSNDVNLSRLASNSNLPTDTFLAFYNDVQARLNSE